MKTIYLDNEFKCHVSTGDGLTAVDTDIFDGKCDSFIEGYRFVPEAKRWTREDGVGFVGPMIAPFRDYSLLLELQKQYETMKAEMEDMKTALDILEVDAE